MKNRLAFVLSGGGSHGALQVGALRALLEAGYRPDLVTGTSIGAANAAFLAVHGFSLAGIERLEQVWKTTINQDLLPSNLWWHLMRAVFQRSNDFTRQRIRDFAIANGVTPEIRFMDLKDVNLYLVASDLNAGVPVIFGADPDESVLEGMLASIALPPWFTPLEQKGRILVDGAAVSNLPIETAILQGATEIIALHLVSPYEVDASARGLRPLLWKLDKTVENRQLVLEMQLAEARGVPVRYIPLTPEKPVPFWDFQRGVELIEYGYQLTRPMIEAWQREESLAWWQKLGRALREGWGAVRDKDPAG